LILLAVRNLLTERTRFGFSAAGIGFAVFLITILLGLYQGWNNKVGGFVEKIDADALVARTGTTDFINAASILPSDLRGQLEDDEAVADVHEVIVRPMMFFNGDSEVGAHLVGYDVESGVAGPVKITKGRGEPRGAEIVVDEVLARTEGVDIGDRLRSGDTEVEVIGFSSGGNFVFTQAAFMDFDAARELLGMDGLTTFFLVIANEGADIPAWQADTESSLSGVTTFTLDEFASATRERILGDVIPIIGLIVGLAFIVGIAITSLTIFTATIEKTREFGVMKAIGFNNLDLYRLVLSQSMLIGAIGFLFGVVLTLVLSRFIDRVVPQFTVLVRPIDVGFVLIATLVMAAGAAIIPARKVGGIDPAVVFRG
jgi:putative ABC transport system permease protein